MRGAFLENDEVQCPCGRLIKESDVIYLSTEDEKLKNTAVLVGEALTAKVAYLVDRLKELSKKDPSKKFIVFSQFPEMLNCINDALKDIGFPFVRFDGSANQDRRTVALEQFKGDENVKLFLCSTKMAACGLTLIGATHAFMMDVTLSPGIEDQAINRIHRIGQKKPVFVEKLVIRDTIEEKLLELHKKIGQGAAGLRKDDKKQMQQEQIKDLLQIVVAGDDDTDEEEPVFSPKPPSVETISKIGEVAPRPAFTRTVSGSGSVVLRASNEFLVRQSSFSASPFKLQTSTHNGPDQNVDAMEM